MNQYAYDGPVMEFENCVAHRWKSTTYAVSEKKQGVILCINLKNSTTGFLIRELRCRVS